MNGTTESMHGHRVVTEYLADTGTITGSTKTIFHAHVDGGVQHRHDDNGTTIYTDTTEIYKASDGSLQEVFKIGTKRGNDYFDAKLGGDAE